MSGKMTARVWALDDEELKDARLLTLLSLADFANSDDSAWPSVPTLAKRTRISERQIQRSIQWLCQYGYIEITEKGNGRGRVTTYKLLIKGDIGDEKGDTMTPFNAKELTSVDSIKGDIGALKGDIQNIKGDIGDEIHSYVRREPLTTEPTEEKEIVADATPTPSVAPVVTVLEKPKRKRKAEPKEPAAPKHPAVIAYHEARHRWPNSVQEKALASVVDDLELWRLVLEKWNLRGYSPVNIDGMLDWYKHPEKFAPRNGATNGTSNGHHQPNYQRPPVANFNQEEWDEYLANREPSPF